MKRKSDGEELEVLEEEDEDEDEKKTGERSDGFKVGIRIRCNENHRWVSTYCM